ncbi:uroporphyrinogen decarboxylase [Paenibacillus taichungensis]|jgi:uroporphyrinogen decarboxylase|uniref:Uroporphyrinogen decarboxylase n=1 Tax=Paenibacillus taichungensis TaxID=484184 RepID=A0A329QXY7_9BACL|nr:MULTISPECIES: uroporphyrinogen decarboxylase [Paenibacillus]OME76578.1 uroporphyrinogen decarboxylase [Paenibacillus pabuli]MDR9744840.1 uroporphyrinogen decarboxylase [Paenibacillus taichungensis]MEC0110647.1 uroporphyrinogen decarboxylase [Paenibacillus taichungensis]MEC0197637.1 uroporphyrinogen decarboxylase [Paenibacillus taichungensis]NUU54546.1 uroporphyrinogen decarboxylase [Paenibacillus taichungensis]
MSYNDRLIQASFKQQVDRVPVWYMRQAGRYDPEYRKIKEKYSLLEICRQPELAAEVTLMPVRKLGVDAAILYSDIMNPVASLGIDFDIVKNIGPVIDNPIRTAADVDRLRPIDVEGDLSHILETIRILDKELDVPLITFAGAPFTIASYLIEGRPSKGYIRTKTMMYSEPEVWHKLMQKLGDMVITYVRAHIANGGKAFQLFDSWVGALSPNDFRTYVLPTITRIFTELSDLNVPKIYFPGVASGELLPTLHDLQADVIGLDWRVSISEGRKRLGGKFAVQGNLDPYVLTAPMDLIKQHAKLIIDEGIKEPGYIFNLGHGLFPEASLDKLRELTAYIHEYSAEALKTGVTVTND